MASGTVPSNPTDKPRKVKESTEVVEYGRFIEGQLKKTRGQVKGVEIAGALLALLAGTLVYLMAVAILDHWVFPSGMGFAGRLICLVVFLAGTLGYAARYLVPLCLRRVNPVYAAHAIERSRPTLKNSLVNFLLLRSARDPLPAMIYQAVEQKAATDLADVSIDGAVDRSRLIQLGYLLMALVAAIGLYKVVSPKDPLRSVGRMALPWANIEAPTRVTIEDVKPGDASAFHGNTLAVSADVQGLATDEYPMLYYTTSDGQTVDQPIKMQRPDGEYRYTAPLPESSSGLQQDLTYYLKAGDDVTERYNVKVLSAPTMLVDALRYEYPKYTRLSPLEQQRGDIKAIEGTQVTVYARANQDIASAYIDFNCDGVRDRALTVNGRKASLTFGLELQRDRITPVYQSYQIRFTNQQGHENPQPIRHTIDVLPDLAPEVRFTAPNQEEVELAANGALNLAVAASDPDYRLSGVSLHAERSRERLLDHSFVLKSEEIKVNEEFLFDAAKLRLKSGDEIVYWASARDNRTPTANVTETRRYRIKIVGPVSEQEREDQIAQAEQDQGGQDGDQPDAGDGQPGRNEGPPERAEPDAEEGTQKGEQDPDQPSGDQTPAEPTDAAEDQQEGAERPREPKENQTENGGADQPREGERQQGDQGEPQERIDPDSNAGDAIEEINKHRAEKQSAEKQRGEEQGAEKQKEQQRQPSEKSKQGNEGQPGEAQRQPGENGQESGDPQSQPKAGEDGEQSEQGQPSDKSSQAKPQDKGEPGGQQSPMPGDQGDKQQGPMGQEAADQDPMNGERPGEPNDAQSSEGGAGDKPSPSDQQAEGNPKADGQKGGARSKADNKSGQPRGKEQAQPGDEGSTAEDQSSDTEPMNGEPMNEPMPKGNEDPAASGEPMPAKGQDAANADEPNKQGSPAAGENQEQKGEQQPSTGSPKAKEQEGAAESPEPGDQEQGNPTPGKGAQTKGSRQGEKKPASDEEAKPDAEGGDPLHEKGESGAGESNGDNKGGTTPQEASAPRKKKQTSPGKPAETKPENESAQSPSNSKNESDSQGETSGDRSGGGESGGGQQASKPGTGGPGQNTESDEGGSESDNPGEGNTSSEAGDKVAADRKTGKSGQDQSGAGSEKRPGSSKPGESGQREKNQPSAGQSSGGKQDGASQAGPGEGQPAQPGKEQNPNPASTNDGDNQADKNDAGQNQVGGGAEGENDPAARSQQDDPSQASDPNLDYANQATDLAIEHLKDQLAKDQPDQELLEKLQWTREDMERFVRRWEEMKAKAKAPGAEGQAAREELDETLKSLGLRPQGTTLRGDQATKEDRHVGVRESRRTSPPPGYAEQYRAYSEGAAKGRRGK